MQNHLGCAFENTLSSVPGHNSRPELSVIAVPAGSGPKPDSSMSTNNRRTSRQAINSPAWLEIGSDARLRRCKLVDISANGARLIVENNENIPDGFNLLLSRFGSPSYHCTVVWKQGDEMGVEFLVSPPSDGEAADSGAALE
jgi:PilZ domain